KMTELRGKYLDHVEATLKLAGDPDALAKANAKKILDLETKLAIAWMSKEDRREPKKIDHRATRAELVKLVPGFPWDPWLEGVGASSVARFNVAQPDFLKAVGILLGGKVPIAEWKTYLRWHVFRVAADYLPKRFVDENFRWRQALVGAEKLPPRWKRC